MYEFQAYNPALPQIITSFKGNQKLILGGYRYNIHHVKEGVKTWRCVCAKKLTGARSWCKGRAETWDNDTKGIPKGDHNHATEHELAEMEFFKSQLILAAISEPGADLNVLMDEASKLLSEGLNFGNRESMKKSLIVARKSVESGEFKLGEPRVPVGRSSGSKKQSASMVKKRSLTSAMADSTTSDTVPSSSTTKGTVHRSSATDSSHPSSSNAKSSSSSKRSTAPTCATQSTASSSAALSSFPLLNSSVGSANSSGFGSSSGMFDDSGTGGGINWMNLSGNGTGLMMTEDQFGGAPNSFNGNMFEAQAASVNEQQQLLAAALFAAAMLGSGGGADVQQQQQQQPSDIPTSSSSVKPNQGRAGRAASSKRTTAARSSGAGAVQQQQCSTSVTSSNANVPSSNARKKTDRVNCILNKLSTKAAEKSVSPSPSSVHSEQSSIKMDVEEAPPKAEQITVATQTDPITVEDTMDNDDDGEGTKSGRKRKSDENAPFGHQHNANNTNNAEKCKVICCCCCEDADLDGLEMPPGCKKRVKKEEQMKMNPAVEEVKLEPELVLNNGGDDAEEEEVYDLEKELKLEIGDDEREADE